MKYHVVTLGSIELSAAGTAAADRVSGLGSQAFPMALLGVLAARQGPVRREELVALLWPESTPSAARNSLNQLVARIRRESGDDLLVSEYQSLALHGTEVRSDVAELAAAAARGDADAVLDLYGGEFLPGLIILRSPEFEEWLTAERRRLLQLVVDAVEPAARRLLEAGSAERAGALAVRLLRVAPLYEPAVRLALEASLAGASPGTGLACYRDYCQRSVQQLGTGPSRAAEQLAAQLHAANAAAIVSPAPAAPPGPVPRDAGRAVDTPAGRAPRHVRPRLVAAVVGALVLAAGVWAGRHAYPGAHAAAASFPDVVAWVDEGVLELGEFRAMHGAAEERAGLVRDALLARLGEQRRVQVRTGGASTGGTALRVDGLLEQRAGMDIVRVMLRSDAVHASREFELDDLQQGIEAAALFLHAEIAALRAQRRVAGTAPSQDALTTVRKAIEQMAAGAAQPAGSDLAAARSAYEAAWRHAGDAARQAPAWIEPVLVQAEAANQVGWSFVAAGSLDDAQAWLRLVVRHADEAAAIDPADARAHDWRGQAGYYLWAIGNDTDDLALLDPVIRSLEEAVRLDPGSGNAWATLATIRLDRGEYRAAADAAGRALESDIGINRVESLHTLFLAHFNAADGRAARAACGRLESERAGYWDAAFCRHLLMLSGDAPPDLLEARRLAAEHLTREQRHPRDFASLVLLQLQQAIGVAEGVATPAQALAELRRLESRSSPAHALFLAASYRRIGASAEAERVIRLAEAAQGRTMQKTRYSRLFGDS
jgi:DNA-binding SARP family transcriptional activator/tetratricopeptide (TPR) repeat protein